MPRFKSGDSAIYLAGSGLIEVTIQSAMSNKRSHRYLVSAHQPTQHPGFGRRVVQDAELERVTELAPEPRRAHWPET